MEVLTTQTERLFETASCCTLWTPPLCYAQWHNAVTKLRVDCLLRCLVRPVD